MGIFQNTQACTSTTNYVITPSDYDKYLIDDDTFGGGGGSFELPQISEIGVGDTIVIADPNGHISAPGPSLTIYHNDTGPVRVNGTDVDGVLIYPFAKANVFYTLRYDGDNCFNLTDSSLNSVFTPTFIAGYGLTPMQGTIIGGVTSVLGNLQNYINDDSYTGEVLYSETSGEPFVFGQLCYRKDDGKWYLADATAATAQSTYMLGICLVDCRSANSPTSILTRGYLASAITTASKTGEPLFMSAASAGSITYVAPSTSGNVVRIVGHTFWDGGLQTNGATVMYFNPDNTWLEL